MASVWYSEDYYVENYYTGEPVVVLGPDYAEPYYAEPYYAVTGGGITGALQAQQASAAGIAVRTITGTSTLQAQITALAGAGTVTSAVVSASGALQAQQASAAGTAARAITGVGALQAQTSSLASVGDISRTANGSLLAQIAEVSGVASAPAPEANSYLASFVSGNVATPANALGAPDGVYTTDGNTQVSWVARWQHENTGDVVDPAKMQEITLRVRKGTNTSNPTVDLVTLYQNGTAVATLLNTATTVSSTTGQDIVLTFSGSVLDGTTAGVDLEITVTGPGGPPSARNSVELDAAIWLIGVGVPTHSADGDLQSAQAAMSGAGEVTRVVSGNLQAQTADATGDGVVGRTASGTLQAAQAAVSGAASHVKEATGGLHSAQATVSGVGTNAKTANGALLAPRAGVDGAGDIVADTSHTAAGAVAAQQAEVVGEATAIRVAVGAFQAAGAVLAATASRGLEASGSLSASPASVYAEGFPAKTAAGALTAAGAALSGEGETTPAPRVAEGELQAAPAAVVAAIMRTVQGSGSIKATVSQVGVYPWIELHTQDSEWTEQLTDWGRDL